MVFAGKVFQQIVGIPMGTNCAPLLADIFLYSYEAEFIQSLLSAGKKRLASQFNFIYRYIDDVLSINNPEFENYLGQMYPPELEIKDSTESNTSASYLDLLLSIGRDGQLRTSLYDKRDDFNFHITNFPFLSTNIPSSPAYGVFISQLIRYARACSSYVCFILRAMRLSNKLLGQGYVKERLKSSLRKFYGRYGDLTKQYEVPLSRMLHDILDDDHIQWHHNIDRTLHQFLAITDLDLITEFDFLPNCARFPENICNVCGMPTEDAYSSGHLVLSHFGTCMCSNVETNISWTCLVSGLLNFEHPSVLLFCLLWRWHHQGAWVSGRQHFRGFCGKGFPADSRYSNGNKLCPSSGRHISLLIWSRIYTVFALKREETVGHSVQFHIQVHRWWFVDKQPRVWELPGPDVSRWARDQRHDREQHFCFLPGFTSVDRKGRTTSHLHLWQTWRFQFPHHKFSLPE